MFCSPKILCSLLLAWYVVELQAANPNVETVTKMCSILQETGQGQIINEDLKQRLLSQMIGFHTPKVDCNYVSTNQAFGFNILQEPVTACFAEATNKFLGMQIIDVQCKDPAADESGKTVMTYQPTKLKLPNGETVSMPMVAKYDFNDDGKIVAFSNQFDTSVMKSMTPAAKNKATIERLCFVLKTMRGSTVNDALLQKLMSEMAGFYAPKVSCESTSTSGEFGFNLIQKPVAACFTEATEKLGGMQVIDIQCEDPAADESGRSVLQYQPAKFKLPNGETISMPIVAKYDFDDNGKIVAFSNQFDTSAMKSMTPAAKNKATIERLCFVVKTMRGSTVNDALLQKLVSEMAGFYAPKVSCDWISTSEFGFNLIQEPVAACFAEATKKFVGMQVIDVQCEHPAADESGRSVMQYQPTKFKLPNGEMVSISIVAKYDFNDDGKIVAFSNQFDTSVMKSMTPAAKNKATIERLCRISKKMQGSTVNEDLMQRLLSEMIGFYAPKVDCNWVSTSEEFGFNIRQEPVATCFAEATKKNTGMQIVEILCEEPAVDLSGSSVMLYQPSQFKLPTGELVSVPWVSKYDFNDDGKIVAFSNQFDTSVMVGTSASAKNKATIERMSLISKKMQGQTVDETMMQKLISEMVGFYAPKVNCSTVSTSKKFGYNFVGVPVSACFAELTKKFGGIQIVNFQFEKPLADSSGKIVMSFQQSKLKLPTGEAVSVPMIIKYQFDDEGLIIASDTQFDTSVLHPQSTKHVARDSSIVIDEDGVEFKKRQIRQEDVS